MQSDSPSHRLGQVHQEIPTPRGKQAARSPSQDNTATTSHHHGTTPSIDGEDEPGIIINIIQSEDRAWDSEVDGNQDDSDQESERSSTSTPDYKRGNHSQQQLLRAATLQVQQEGKEFKLNRRCQPAVLLLSDTRMSQWPRDSFCQIEHHPGWNLDKWLAMLRAEAIRVCCNTVVIYFEKAQGYQGRPTIKK